MDFYISVLYYGGLKSSILDLYKALLKYTVGSRQTEHKSQGELMEEDNIAKNRVDNTLVQERERDNPMREEGGCKPEEFIRGGQGLAEG